MKSGRSDIRPPVSFKLDGPHVPFSFHAAKCFADSPAYCLTDTVSINMIYIESEIVWCEHPAFPC